MLDPALPCSSLGTVILTFVFMLMKESVEISPVPYTLQVHRIPLDGRDPSSSLSEKRQIQCQLGQYLHPRETHCCMRCHAGTYKAKDCDRPDQAPICLPCANGTFTAVDNTMSKCFQCTRCRTEFQQIVETPCTPKQDTICGCRKNQYQIGLADLFQCRNCSSCVNGTITDCDHSIADHRSERVPWLEVISPCPELTSSPTPAATGPLLPHLCLSTKNKDAVCRCRPGFFLTLRNVCKPCNSCIGEECLLCHSPVTAPPTSTGLNGSLVLGIIVAIFGVIFILYIVKKVVKLIQKKRITSSSSSCATLPQTTKEPVSEVEVKRGEISILLPESRKETELLVNATPPPAPLPQSSHEFPDCVRPARKRQLPDSPSILYTVVDRVPPSRWKEFVRRLGLSDHDLERIEMEHRCFRDAQYEMLRQWKLQMSHAATVEHISCVLNQMELSGCSEAIQEALLNQSSQPCSFHIHP